MVVNAIELKKISCTSMYTPIRAIGSDIGSIEDHLDSRFSEPPGSEKDIGRSRIPF